MHCTEEAVTILVNLNFCCVCLSACVFQEQYQRDQERLEAEWRRAQQDAIVSFRTESVVILSGPLSLFQALVVITVIKKIIL